MSLQQRECQEVGQLVQAHHVYWAEEEHRASLHQHAVSHTHTHTHVRVFNQANRGGGIPTWIHIFVVFFEPIGINGKVLDRTTKELCCFDPSLEDQSNIL